MNTVNRHTPIGDLPELLSVDEAASWLGVGKGLIYELARRGDLASIRLGRLLKVPRSALAAMVERRDA